MKCEYKEFCDECAETMDYECDCIVYRNIHPIKKSGGKKK